MTVAPGRVLGIDYGSRRVGLALSDPLRVIAQGAGTLDNDAALIDRLAALIAEQGITLIIVGMPYAANGGKGAKAVEIDRFIDRLKRSVHVAVETWDESYSSVAAHRVFIEGGMKRKKRQEKSRVDEMAARILLQEFLENYAHRDINPV